MADPGLRRCGGGLGVGDGAASGGPVGDGWGDGDGAGDAVRVPGDTIAPAGASWMAPSRPPPAPALLTTDIAAAVAPPLAADATDAEAPYRDVVAGAAMVNRAAVMLVRTAWGDDADAAPCAVAAAVSIPVTSDTRASPVVNSSAAMRALSVRMAATSDGTLAYPTLGVTATRGTRKQAPGRTANRQANRW